MKIKKEVIVTGGSGFLGKNLIQSISKKYKIISVDRKIKSNSGNFTHFKANIKKFFKKKNLKNVFAIIHLATSESRANFYNKSPNLAKKNIDDLIVILEKIKKQRNKILFIFASSRDTEKNKFNRDRDLYSFSKEYSENLIKQYSLNSSFVFNILRMPDLFDYKINNNPKSKALSKIVKNLENSQDIIIDNPLHTFEYISIKEISEVIKNILEQNRNVNSILSIRGEKIKIVKLVKKITKLKSSNSKIILKRKIKNSQYKYYIRKNKKKNFFKELILN